MRQLKIAVVFTSLSLVSLHHCIGQTVQSPDVVTQTSAGEKTSKESGKKKPAPKQEGWKPMLPARGLGGWEITDFGGNGRVQREGELLVFQMGDPLNGINSKKKDFPKDNFEISLDAKRIEGNDFLCGLTFPVGEEFCSFIAGGWGGGVVGLSSVDGADASENATTTYHDFENGKWYRFKVRVDHEQVRVWIDDQEFFRQERDGHEFSTRIELYSCQPLGFCTYLSEVAVKNFKWRSIGKKINAKDSNTKDKAILRK